MNYYLAVDIGASSGRHILGSIADGKIRLEEIYRFDNHIRSENGSLTWDVSVLTREVIAGIAKCKEIGKIPVTVAIDTWGVDYVLLDENRQELLPVFCYRDSRTDFSVSQVEKILPYAEIYERTGIQKLYFNTLYQLYCDKISGKLGKAKHFLMMPDYLSFRLTGKISNEYTNATTGALVNAEKKTWDTSLLNTLGVSSDLFLPLAEPGTELGAFSEEIQAAVGFNATVIHAPSHDTAAAVAACPIEEESIYISSGTWSLIGTENAAPVLTKAAREANFTNEGGVEYRFRFLKNIMGMWLFQSIRRDLMKKYTYDEMMEMARDSAYTKTFDCNHPSLVAPENMTEAIKALLGEELPLPDVLSSVYHSLARSYQIAVEEIETLSGKRIRNILIVGGGSKDKYLNALTARVTGKRVFTGLPEATALGNILSQIMYEKKISLNEARQIVKNSFEIREDPS